MPPQISLDTIPQDGFQAVKQRQKAISGLMDCNQWPRSTQDSPLLMQWISQAVSLPFCSSPPPFHNDKPQQADEETAYWESKVLPKMFWEGAVTEIPGPTPWVSSSRLEPKSSGGNMHAMELRPINLHLPVPKCKYLLTVHFCHKLACFFFHKLIVRVLVPMSAIIYCWIYRSMHSLDYLHGCVFFC